MSAEKVEIGKNFSVGIIKDEWPTLIVLLVCYAGYFAITYFAHLLSIWLSLPLLTLTLVLHSSLQHEVLHGHPTGNPYFNDLLVFLPLGVFIPYLRFKDTHLAHHFDPNLTDPYDDPESNFLDPKKWDAFSQLVRTIYRFNNTLLGRMVIGPVIGLLVFYSTDSRSMLSGNKRVTLAYGLHAVGLIVVFAWLYSFSAMPLWQYAVAAYLCMSVLKIRTYLEHRAHDRVASRTVIVENGGLLGFLFLNNNLHSAHHACPRLQWHKLPQAYRAKRQEFDRRNDGYYYKSYWQIMQSYLFRCKDPVAHPLMQETKGRSDWRKSERIDAG